MIAIAALPGAVDKAKIVEPPSIEVLVDLIFENRLVRDSAELGNIGPSKCRHRPSTLRAKIGNVVEACGI